MKPNSWIVAILAIMVFAADQISKYAIVTYVGMGRMWTPIPGLAGLVGITPGYNTGTACGYLPQLGKLFTFAPLVILVIVIAFYLRQSRPDWLLTISTGLIIGGAFGNLADRLRLGYVVDFIQVSRWPVFNVADSALSTAIVLLLFWSLREDAGRPIQQGVAGEMEQAESKSRARSMTWKLVLSFLVLLGVLAALGFIVCVYVPANFLQ